MALAEHAVVALSESRENRPSFILAVNLKQWPSIRGILWNARKRLVGDMGTWLAGLPAPPASTILLGGGCPLTAETVLRVAVMFREALGLAPQHRTRPVCLIEPDGTVVTWPSTTLAAKENRVSRGRIFKMLGLLTISDRGVWL
jgi:hypothetical protein